MKRSLILGLESSCDETAAALMEQGGKLRASVVLSQAGHHARFGGVVPEIASRAHLDAFPMLLEQLWKEGDAAPGDLAAVAATKAPGLIGSLLVGLSLGRAMAYRLGVPFVPVHHVQAHLFAAALGEKPVLFPALGFIASGAHTEIWFLQSWTRAKRLAATRDDALGEAFDKVGKLLGLPYPGGPHVEKWAEKSNGKACAFSPVRLKDKTLDFSFSGFKTAVRLAWERSEKSDREKAEIAAGFQKAALEEVRVRVAAFLRELRPRTLVAGGGVLANRALRSILEQTAKEEKVELCLAPLEFCGDNAAMVAGLAEWFLKEGYLPKEDVGFEGF